MCLLPVFYGWRRVTTFHPKSSVLPISTELTACTPVYEFTRYMERTFYRKRHSMGVTFATFVPGTNGREIGVVWTTARKAHLFEYINGNWVVVKTLNRQDDPFITWTKFLGGRETLQAEMTAAAKFPYESRTPEKLFYDLVFPFFGRTQHSRNPIYERSIPTHHATWQIVRLASVLTLPEDHPSRFQWHRL